MWLLAIYGMTFASAGLLGYLVFPQVQEKVKEYIVTNVAQSNQQLTNIFINVSEQRVLLLHTAAPLVGAVIGYVALNGPIGVVVGFGLGVVMPRALVRMAVWNRLRKFQTQLVDSLLAISSSLRAGLSLLQCFDVLAEELPPPMSQEIGLVAKETKMGLSLDESLKRFKKRMPVDELNLVVTAMLVARETGGDVTAVFTKLIDTIRERQKIKERIKTLTVIPRMQGWLMAAIPFVFGSFAMKMNPLYFDMMLKDPVGQMIAMAAVGLWVTSIVLILWFSRPPS